MINASLSEPTSAVPDADVDSLLDYLYIVSQYTVRLMTPCVWRILSPQLKLCTLLSATTEFTNCMQHAETESAPNVVRLLSAETECLPKVPICPHSAPKPKPKPKFDRPLDSL